MYTTLASRNALRMTIEAAFIARVRHLVASHSTTYLHGVRAHSGLCVAEAQPCGRSVSRLIWRKHRILTGNPWIILQDRM